jgi:poly(3-hydroxybutyrate) depolymerase
VHRLLTSALIGCIALAPAFAQTTAVLDYAAAPGANYANAEFRLWLPEGRQPVRAAIVIVPGSNGDWRSMVSDTTWQAFATKHHLALVGCRITDKQHDQGFIEEYVNVSRGSGQALLDAMTDFAKRANHPELATAPFFMWGMSAGGQFNYEFAAWKPERVAAFVVNKGGIYYSALTSAATRNVPAILFTGGKDLEFRVNTIVGLFAVNRRGGALWALAEEPGVGHVVSKSQQMTMIFFEDLLPLRLIDESEAGALRPLTPKSGFIGDFKTKTFVPAEGLPAPTGPTAWLPTARVARAWQAMVTEQPITP